MAEFVTDHFGQETLDYLAEPLLSGVYGGDPAQLSVGSVLPRFLEMEAKYGSLVRGVLAGTFEEWRRPQWTVIPDVEGRAGNAGGSLWRARESLPARMWKLSSARRAGFRVRAGGEWMEADQVIVACPAWSAARLVAGLDARLAELLGSIDYSSSLTLSLIYRAADFDGKRAGFGFLVPKKERQRLAACTFVGTKFSYRVPDDRIVLRCFFGGIGDAAILNESDESVVAIAREELRRILGLTAAPDRAQHRALATVHGAIYAGPPAARGGNPRRGPRRFRGCIWRATLTRASAFRTASIQAARPPRRRLLLYRDAHAVGPELDALDVIAAVRTADSLWRPGTCAGRTDLPGNPEALR